jgi:hypothetical protein
MDRHIGHGQLIITPPTPDTPEGHLGNILQVLYFALEEVPSEQEYIQVPRVDLLSLIARVETLKFQIVSGRL